MIMKNTPMKASPGNVLKVTLASSLLVLLGGCASPADNDSQAPQATASQPVAMQASNDASTEQVVTTQDASGAQHQQAVMAENSARTDGLVTELHAMGAHYTNAGMVMTLGDGQFRHGHAQLLPEGEQAIVKLADFLKRHPEVKVDINGYYDNASSFDNNLKFSQARADAIVSALEDQGVPAANLSAHAYGQIGWIASNKTAEGRSMNRHVDIVFDLAGDTTASQ
jgi:outer membrane protein OmpA-like peptidoglycan-associated protein